MMNTPPQTDLSPSGSSTDSTCSYDFSPSAAAQRVSKALGLTLNEMQILYEELEKCDEDPILVFKANNQWVYTANPVNTAARRDHILDEMARWEMCQDERRDSSAERFLFHFNHAEDIDRCKKVFKGRFREAFGVSADAKNEFAILANMNPATIPDAPALGETYAIYKIQVRQDDFQRLTFFYL
uniref:Uncharacterized protein n=1 Tax=Acrobeloides nanus TaxID=290746 RepID=A0A914DP53_9BILA